MDIGYKYLSLINTSVTITDAAILLHQLYPSLDTFYCSIGDWKKAGFRGDYTRVVVSIDLYETVRIIPDMYCPDRTIHGVRTPAIDIGGTLT